MKKNPFSIDSLNKFRTRYFIMLIAIFIISIIFSWVISSFYKLNLPLRYIFFLFFFLSLFIVFDFLFRGDKEEWKFNVQLMLSILTIFIFLGQLLVLNSQTQISAQQTQILDRTTQSNKANLDLFPSENDRYYSYLQRDIDEKDREQERLPVGIINYGKSLAPFIEVQLVPNEFIAKQGYFWEIQNLQSLEYQNYSFYIVSKQNITEGLHNLTFSIRCPYCEVPYKEENLSICIYTDHFLIEEECGEGWRP